MAPDIVVLTNFGKAEGREAAIALLKEPRISGLLGAAQWSEPAVTTGRGVAIVVDLDKVEGRGPTGRVLMVRSRSSH